MQRFVGLIRGINVGGANRLSMADLGAYLQRLGFTDVRTLLQSGNFVFSSGIPAPKARDVIQAGAREALGIDPRFFVRDAREWKTLIEECPFASESKSDPSHVLAFVFDQLPTAAQLEEVTNRYDGPEAVELRPQALYVWFPEGFGRSKLMAIPAWKRITAASTARNWNTVLKLGAQL